MQSDVLIVGGGPAGLYAAQLLARRGLSVEVLEEHDRIGEPVHCTGLVASELFELPGVPAGTVLATPRTARFHSPTGHRLTYDGREGEVCVIDRAAFDRDLAAAAARAGARVTTRARVVTLDVGRDGVALQVETAAGRLARRAATCLLACGARYGLQRRLGWSLPRLVLASAQTEVRAPEAEGVDVFLREELLPQGFAWRVPIRRAGAPQAKVGVMASAHPRPLLARLLEDLQSTGAISGPAGAVNTRLLPLGPLERTYGDRILAIGDAAGLTKPTTGGGIYYSLLSAGWAVEALAGAFASGEFGAARLARYEELWKARLGPEQRAGMWFRRLAQRFRSEDLDALVELTIRDGVLPVVRAAARFNWHRDMILRSFRHPGVLKIVVNRILSAQETRHSALADAPPLHLHPQRRP